MFNTIETREEYLEKLEDLPPFLVKLLKEDVKLFDELCPDWEWFRVHGIIGRSRPTYDSPDIVYELPNRVFLRGWDMSAAISRDDLSK